MNHRGGSGVMSAEEQNTILSNPILRIDCLIFIRAVFLKSGIWPPLILGRSCMVQLVVLNISLFTALDETAAGLTLFCSR